MDIRNFFTPKPSASVISPNVDVENTADECNGNDTTSEIDSESLSSVVIAKEFELPDAPNQPSNVNVIPPQVLSERTLKFQKSWFEKFQWLHFETSLGAVLCHTCALASRRKLIDLAKCKDEAFVSKGFKNWRKLIEKCNSHVNSTSHKLAVKNMVTHITDHNINMQLNVQLKNEQEESQMVLIKLITSLRYLAQQGLAIRGKNHDNGNFANLLALRSDDDVLLKTWLKKSRLKYTSAEIQNEMLEIMCSAITEDICEEIKKAIYFGVIIDGTQDIEGTEQEAVCIRYVDRNFEIHEMFLGLCNVPDTTGEALCNMLIKFLDKIQLPIANLRAQTYDGAANMSGVHKGCQARVKEFQPLAKYYHCGAHVTHLVTSKAIGSAEFMKDALETVQELGSLYSQSGKFKHLYLRSGDEHDVTVKSLKPVCPTRWLTRAPAVEAVLENYPSILTSLDAASNNFGTTTASRANGIQKQMKSGKFILGLVSSLPILKVLEGLNKILQSRSTNVSGMLDVVKSCLSNLTVLRTKEEFTKIFHRAEDLIDQFGLDEITIPRARKIPKKLDDGNSEHYNCSYPEEKFRVVYFKAIDTASQQMRSYFESDDINEYKLLAGILLEGSSIAQICTNYPEIDCSALEREIMFFRNQFANQYSSMDDCRKLFSNMVPEVKRMFPQVEILLRLLLLSPASSCEAERTFSALRRLKTWLRSTMTQNRLNSVMMCHVHQENLMKLDPKMIAQKFIWNSKTDEQLQLRSTIFGKFFLN